MERNLTLLTDLYQLTMMNGYLKQGREKEVAVFDIFFRQNGMITYSLAVGLEQAMDYICNLSFGKEELDYLESLRLFDEPFIEYLRNFRFTGDVYAVPEGTVVFPGEPIFTVRAPIIEAQLIETALLNIINHQTLIASKAAKVCYAAQNDSVMEFGLRRAQGPDAGIYGARAAVIGGCSSTSNVLAGKMFDIPVAGTHAHSWVMNFPDEYTAFMNYALAYPDNILLLVDTYDTLKSGVPNAIKCFDEVVKLGYKPKGIRLDSGDLAYLSKKARKMLDAAGYPYVKICASGDLDEKSIVSLKAQGAAIDLWGVGTRLITSADMPALGGVYKLSAMIENGKEIPKIKLSDNFAKITNPGIKNVYRIYDKETGEARADLIYLESEGEYDDTKPLTITHPTERWKQTTLYNYTLRKLLIPVMKGGKSVYRTPALKQIKEYASREIASLSDEHKRLDSPHIFKVDLSDALYELKNRMIEEIRSGKNNREER
ncbi:MAG: nicotinate phosphoribosyltransferase [Bacillota bacterium]|nr:MAG: nicotinate phosphoribosyltransferase [Bacillota bacterium]